MGEEELAAIEAWRLARRAYAAACAHLDEVRYLPLKGTRLSDAHRAVEDTRNAEGDARYQVEVLLDAR